MDKNCNWLIIVLIILSIWFWRDHRNLKNQLEYSQDELSSCEYDKSALEDALNQANSNIEDAQSYAWSSYDEMGDALDNLETVEP